MKGLIDSTLREGAQKAGVYWSSRQKQTILRQLVALGIEEIEIGRADEPMAELAALLEHGRRLGARRLALWARCTREDVAAAVRLAPDVLSLSLPVSDLLIAKKLQRDRAWTRTTLAECMAIARKAGTPCLSLGLEDATRADDEFLREMMAMAVRSGVDRLRLADTVGVATPATMAALVRLARECGGKEIGVHTHNDFGMATANAVAAIEAGADWADVTVLGLGERSGCARLEEVAGWLALTQGRTGYRPARIRRLCDTVARAAGLTVAGDHPVVGSDIFTCETGLHLIGLYRDPATYEPFAPEAVGGQRRLLLGGKSGRGAVAACLWRLGRECRGEGLRQLTTAIREQAQRYGRPLRDSEVELLAEGVAISTTISRETSSRTCGSCSRSDAG